MTDSTKVTCHSPSYNKNTSLIGMMDQIEIDRASKVNSGACNW